MKVLKLVKNVLAWLLTVVLVVLLVLQVGVTVMYRDFFFNSDEVFRIPGLRSGVVPQGFHYIAEKDI